MLADLGAGRVDFSVGGGIVADSNPADEFDETMDKAAALMAALERGQAFEHPSGSAPGSIATGLTPAGAGAWDESR